MKPPKKLYWCDIFTDDKLPSKCTYYDNGKCLMKTKGNCKTVVYIPEPKKKDNEKR